MKFVKWGLLVLVVLALMLQPVLGQVSGRGEVRGVVRDQNQAVIPGADVTAVNQATNVTLTTITSEVGVYFIGAVPIGAYSLKVEMPGFNTWTTTFTVQAGSTVTINAELQVGDISTSIEVTDTVSEVSIDRLEVADVKDFARIQQLPLNGRSITNLFELTPGVEGGGSPRVSGMKVGSTEMTLDGVSVVDRFGGGMARVQPSLDLIQEFRIETVGSDARFSRPATVTLVSRSGTNEVHGSVFWTHRNNGIGLARRRGEGGDPSKLIRHEFGVTVGGPFWLGDFYDGRDKTFWFFNYEGLRTNQSRRTGFRVTPLPEWWQGDLSDVINSGGTPYTIYNPYTTRADGTRDPFPGNIIPSDMIHPFAGRLEAITAKPNRPGVHPALDDNYIFFYPQTTDADLWTIKGDQVLSDKDNLSVRFTRSKRKYAVAGGVYGNPDPNNLTGEEGSSSRNDATVTNVSVNWNSAMSPSFLNELLVGVNRTWKNSGTLADFRNAAADMGFPNPFNANGWPTFYADCASGWRSCGWDGDNNKSEPQTHITAENNVTWVKGDHVLQLGGKVKIEHNNVRELQQAQGSHSFGSSWSALYDAAAEQTVSYTGDGFAGVLLGLGDYFSNQYNRGYFYFRQNEYGLFVNDKWKVNPRLTVNLGLRWDAWTPYREKYDRLANVDLRTFASGDPFEIFTPGDTRVEDIQGIPIGVTKSWAARGLTWTTANAIGQPSNIWKSDWNNIGPRVGLSYMLTDKTVIRGSYGEYYWTMPLSQILQTARSNPPFNLRFSKLTLWERPGNLDPTGSKSIYPLVNAPGDDDLLENIVVPTDGVVGISSSPRGVFAFDGQNWKDAHARTWHLTLEHEVMRNTAMRFTYTGNMGRDLEQRYTLNDPETQFNYVTRTGENYPAGRAADPLRPNKNWSARAVNRTGKSNTHQGQLEVERRFSDGIGFQAFYVYTRSLTSTDTGGFSSGNYGINSTGGGRVPSFENLYHFPNPVGDHFTTSPSYDELLDLVYFNSANIPPHRVRFNGIVDLPFGRGKAIAPDVSGAVNQIIGGWQVAFIGDWRSGYWLNVNTGSGVFRDYIIAPGDRPEIFRSGQRQTLWFAGDFDPSSCQSGDCSALEQYVPQNRSQRAIHPYGEAFDNRVPIELNDGTTRDTAVLSGHYWPFARNTFMGPRNWNMDLSIFKHFYFTEDIKLRFTADFFNFFNHPNDSNPNSTTGLVNHGTQSNSARTLQLSLRLDW